MRPGAATRILAALDLARDDPRLGATAQAQLDHIERGGALIRPELARLKKRLLAALLEARVDHRAGAYHTAKSAVSQAFRREQVAAVNAADGPSGVGGAAGPAGSQK